MHCRVMAFSAARSFSRIIFDVADINGLRDQHHGYQAGVVARGGSA